MLEKCGEVGQGGGGGGWVRERGAEVCSKKGNESGFTFCALNWKRGEKELRE